MKIALHTNRLFLWLIFGFVLWGQSACNEQNLKEGVESSTVDGLKVAVPLQRKLDLEGKYQTNLQTGDTISPILDSKGVPFLTGTPIKAKGIADKDMESPALTIPAAWEKTDKSLFQHIEKIEGTVIRKSLVLDTLTRDPNKSYISRNWKGEEITSGVPMIPKGRKIKVKFPKSEQALPPFLHYDGGMNLKNINMDQGLPNSICTDIAQDEKGNIWIAQWGSGIVKYDGQSFWHFSEDEGLPTDRIWNMFIDKEGKLWLGTQTFGIIIFDGEYFTHYSPDDGFPIIFVSDIDQDAAGNIWITSISGISKYSPAEDGTRGTFTHHGMKEGLVNEDVYRSFVDVEDNIWAVSTDRVSTFDGTTFSNFQIQHPTENGYLKPIFQDRTGILWLSYQDQLLKYDGSSFTIFPVHVESKLRFMEESSEDGKIWFTPKGTNAYYYDGEDLWVYPILDKDFNYGILDIHDDAQGNIWFGTDGLGIYVLNKSSFVNQLDVDGNLRSFDDDAMWFGNNNGIEKYDGQTVWRLKGSEIRDRIRYILEDRNGNIWIGNFSGIGKYDGKNLTYFNETQARPEILINSILLFSLKKKA